MLDEVGDPGGLHVAIVGDVLHSRVARSLVQLLCLLGSQVTLVGAPTLLPRGVEESLGCATATEIDAIGAADVVYVLRMQRERMEAGAAFVPSLREYSARWAIAERLRPGQRVIAGPMNRGVEIDAQVADAAHSLIGSQVQGRPRRPHGRALRPAHPGAGRRAGRRAAGGRVVPAALVRRPAARHDLLIRGARVVDPGRKLDAALDVLVERGVIAELRVPGSVAGQRPPGDRGRGAGARFRLRQPARPSPLTRTGGRGDDRLRNRRRRGRRLLPPARDAQHRARGRPADALRASPGTAPAARPRCRSASSRR